MKEYKASFYPQCKECTAAPFCYCACTPEEIKTEKHHKWRIKTINIDNPKSK